MIQSYKKNPTLIKNYDTIIIGSGMGSLTTAAILAKDVVGKTGPEIITVRNAVVTMLNGSKYHPDIFADYKFLSPARQFKNRHDSILLSLNATVDAINNIFKGVNS